MNSRERFLACMRFEAVDRAPNWETGYWVDTLKRWYEQGLPRPPKSPTEGLLPGDEVKGEAFACRLRTEPRDYAVHEYLDLDKGAEKVDCETGPCPPFETKILWEDENTVRRQEPDGTVVVMGKRTASLPKIVEWPVKGIESWEQLKEERFRLEMEGRLPPDWEQQLKRYKGRTWPLVIGGPFLGVFSSLRTLFGFENLMYAFFDDPDLIRDVLSHLTELWLYIFENVFAQVQPDYAYYWEDMSYKAGPMVSPRIFRQFLLPVYQEINGFFAAHDIDIVLLDTDGDVWELVPLFLEGGVTGLYPFEVRAGMDVVEVRAEYPHLQMLGGIDKNALAQGPEAIDRELERVAPVVKTGGYVPAVDHYVPPNVSWDNFVYYRQQLRKIL